MMSHQAGTVNDSHGLLYKADYATHWYETKLVTKTGAKTIQNRTIKAGFERSTIKISMKEENKWPT